MTQTLQTLLALVLITGISVPALAQTIDVGAQGDVDLEIGTGSASVEGSAGAEADVADERDAEMTEEDASASDGQEDGTSFSLTRTEATLRSAGSAMVDAGSVNTRSDLEAYAAATLNASDRFESVDVSNDRVVLHFTEDARLFGFIPHTVTSRVEVMADGSVKVERPWYRFLVAGLSADSSADLEARVRSALATEGVQGSLSARSQARVLAEVARSFESGADASASAEGSAEVSPN